MVAPLKYATIIADGLKPEIVAPLLCGESPIPHGLQQI